MVLESHGWRDSLKNREQNNLGVLKEQMEIRGCLIQILVEEDRLGYVGVTSRIRKRNVWLVFLFRQGVVHKLTAKLVVEIG